MVIKRLADRLASQESRYTMVGPGPASAIQNFIGKSALKGDAGTIRAIAWRNLNSCWEAKILTKSPVPLEWHFIVTYEVGM